MTPAQLTITLAAVMIINQWVIALFNRKKQAKPKTKPVSSVEPKAKRSLGEYVAVAIDLGLLIFAIYLMRAVSLMGKRDVVPTLDIVIQISILCSFLAALILYQFQRALSGVTKLWFPSN
jgi:hypothetical protein